MMKRNVPIDFVKRKRDSEDDDVNEDSDYVADIQVMSEDEVLTAKENKKSPGINRKLVKVTGNKMKQSLLKVHVLDSKVEKRTLFQRISCKQFSLSVIQNMSELRKRAIREIGFGGFLDIDLILHKFWFAEKLVDSFNVNRCSLCLNKGIQIDLCKEDFHAVYGVPCGGTEIEELEIEEGDEWLCFMEEWRLKFGLSNRSPTNAVVIAKLDSLKNELTCDEFIWNFLICVVKVWFE
ncbi:hypothetical protein M5689_003340 [Euphorbia peplus]|nr:hypothetical protein M5689_003340 [Euphorbia peplus]